MSRRSSRQNHRGGPPGRPRYDPAHKRYSLAHVYATPAETVRIRVRARLARKSISAYLVAAGLSRPIVFIPPINREAYASLARIGSNLNQLAKHLNSGTEIPFPGPMPDLHLLAGLLLAVRRQLIARNDPQDPAQDRQRP